MMKALSRGAVLVQVLVMSLLLLILATALVKMVTQHYQFGSLAIGSVSGLKVAEASISTVQTGWTLSPNNGLVCSSYIWSPDDQFGCSGTPGVCACTCGVRIGGNNYPSVVAGVVGSSCVLTASTESYP